MNHPSYKFDSEIGTQYTFISSGRQQVQKIVDFTPTTVKNVYNLGFGDILPDGTVDDKSNSNNGDILKVLSTVVHIVEDFTDQYPHIKILFTGSTDKRTVLYRRILTTYFPEFQKGFRITGIIKGRNGYKEIVFHPDDQEEYLAFFIEKK